MTNYQIAVEGMQEMIGSVSNPLKSFKRNAYPVAFKEYYNKYLPVFDAIEELYTTVMEPDTMLENMADALVEKAKERVSGLKRKNDIQVMQLDLNLALAVYVHPSILKYKGKSSKVLSDMISVKWKEAFPKSNVQASEYEFIEKGFHRKFCYITTAVCNTLGKEDDCYELTLLRDYRDHYLSELPEGQSLIRRYYDLAPTIVKHINESCNSNEIYRGIWEDYLSPCIRMIENDENASCCDLYQKMVYDLKDSYFYK